MESLGHGDALHVSDMVPSNPGLETFMPQESPDINGYIGFAVRDAKTGTSLFTVNADNDVGRGVAADIDPNSPGFEYWATTNFPGETPSVYGSDGVALYPTPANMFINSVVWWDGDLTRELLDGTTISEWNNPGRSNFDLDPGTGGTQIFAPNASSNNGTKKNAALSADIFGDWREEVIWRRSDNSALDIYTTIIPAQTRIYSLMHDVQYCEAIAWQNVGYNQPPHPSFFLGAGMAPPPIPQIYYAGEVASAAAVVIGRGVAYSGASAAYGATTVDPTISALLPGENSTTANFTNYSRGLNRVIIDIENRPQATLTIDCGLRTP